MPSNQVSYLDLAPMAAQIFRDQSPMAMVRLVFTAQQAAGLDHFLGDRILNMALFHEVEKALFINAPLPLVLLVLVKNFLGRRQIRHVDVVEPANFLEKVGQVLLLRKASQMRNGVEVYVDHSLGARTPEQAEKTAPPSFG